jgi:2-methylcitrate dehydratase PrpD
MHPPVDKFIHIIEENNIRPEEIEKVEFTPHVIGLNRAWKENTLRTEEDFGFHGPYLIACAAHRIKSIDFQNPSVKNDPKIREFMKKVTVLPNPHKDFGLAMIKNRMARVHTVEVQARGKSFKETVRCAKWSCSPEGRRPTDEELVEKFKEIVSDFLPLEKTEKATKSLLALEKFGDINDLMEVLRP